MGGSLAAAGSPALRLDLPGTARQRRRAAATRIASPPGRPRSRARPPGCASGAPGGGCGARPRAGRPARCGSRGGRGAAIDDLALWGVPARGRALVRELRAFAALKQDEWGDGAAAGRTSRPDGFDVTGYLIADATRRRALGARPHQLPLPGAAGRRVLLLGRDAPARRPPTARARRRAAGPRSRRPPGRAGARWWASRRTPSAGGAAARVAEWLRGAPARARPALGGAPVARDVLGSPGADERPWTADRAFGRQFGILARPDGDGERPLGVLLLNAGAVRHTGPNRMWVEVARRWAPQGVPCCGWTSRGSATRTATAALRRQRRALRAEPAAQARTRRRT